MPEENKEEINMLSELDAFQKLANILQPFDKEKQKKLLELVYKLFELELSQTVPDTARSLDTSIDNKQKIMAFDFSTDRSLSPKEFLFEKKPKTDVERVACLAYYLTYYKDKPHFQTIHISKLNTDAAQIKFSNPTVAVDNATKRGYLVPATKGHKQLSANGELFVQALPDRAAAKETMRNLRQKRKSKSQIKKSNKKN